MLNTETAAIIAKCLFLLFLGGSALILIGSVRSARRS